MYVSFTYSFSDGGTYGTNLQRTVDQALRLVREGAGMLDVGGESTRPGAQAVPAEEELRRVLPAIRCEPIRACI
jgi:dihydropteroate synthase